MTWFRTANDRSRWGSNRRAATDGRTRCAAKARLIGVIECERLDGKEKIRNDRHVAVAEVNHMYANIRRRKDLPGKWLDEVQDFFVNYHGLRGRSTSCWDAGPRSCLRSDQVRS
jgi:inorganic pyrophosphatase